VIHTDYRRALNFIMDCRVKPGNDKKKENSASPPKRAHHHCNDGPKIKRDDETSGHEREGFQGGGHSTAPVMDC
jgi:hypothetical protein